MKVVVKTPFPKVVVTVELIRVEAEPPFETVMVWEASKRCLASAESSSASFYIVTHDRAPCGTYGRRRRKRRRRRESGIEC